jgi:RNA polymerase sigma factor (sigma-70 family)
VKPGFVGQTVRFARVHFAVGEDAVVPGQQDEELLGVHESLDRLSAHEPRKAELVKLRFFAGLTIEEAADLLGISAPTAKRDWAYARAWLFRDLESSN